MSSKPCRDCGPAGHDGDADRCGDIAMERNRYFTGKYMAARDFSLEQEYFLSRHRLHNRVLHGWGVVCGLRVVHHPDLECRKRWVVVKAGIAIDCCGREVVLFKDTALELPLPTWEHHEQHEEHDEHEDRDRERDEAQTRREQEPRGRDRDERHDHDRDDERPHGHDYPVVAEYLVCVRTAEHKVEKVPALYNEGACDPSKEDYNRVRECAELVVLDPKEVPDCWRSVKPVTNPEEHCCNDCDEPIPGPAGICLTPECPCKDTVPLALLQWVPRDRKEPLRIQMDGRRTLPTPPEFLTHIIGVNWPHGGTITLTHLREVMKGRLEVNFDRKLTAANGMATGINEFTFLVEYGDVQRDVEFLPTARRPSLEGDCRAVYVIDPDILLDDGRGVTLSNHMIFVTIHCDFILDCHDNAVDGNFLGARFPTGNGIKGSTFRSWFRVRERERYDHSDYSR